MIRKRDGKYFVYSEKGKKLSKGYRTLAAAKKRLRQIEWFKTRKKKFRRKVDTKMRDYGEIDYDKAVIRVNPRKGGLLDTILHEEEHRIYPDKTEKEVRKAAKKKEKSLTIGEAIAILKKYQKKRKKK